MTRAPRILFENAWYHIINRGAGRQPIFKTDENRQLFLEKLAELGDRFSVEVHAYCLMNNHFHLLVRTPTEGLSAAMKHLIGTYTKKFNRSEKRDGPLFRSRFKSIVIDADAYLLEVSRYIHNNPVEAKIVVLPQDYRWSSYSAYIYGTGKVEPWLHTGEILKRVDDYRAFVEQPRQISMAKFYCSSRLPGVLGSKEFKHYVSALGFSETRKSRADEHGIGASDICAKTASFFQCDIDELLQSRQGKGNLARSVAMYLVKKYTNLTIEEMATHFQASKSGISTLLTRNRNLLEVDGKGSVACRYLEVELGLTCNL